MRFRNFFGFGFFCFIYLCIIFMLFFVLGIEEIRKKVIENYFFSYLGNLLCDLRYLLFLKLK